MNTSKKSNTLISHTGERITHRIDKMTGWFSSSKYWRGVSKKFSKKFTNKKRRQLLKQNKEEKF